MGVTIHFEGGLGSEVSYEKVVDMSREFALSNGWPCEPIAESFVTLSRVRNEQDWDYEGPTKGVVLQPHENSDPLRLEFDSSLYVQEYCKTQFAPLEVHIQVIELLRRLEPEFAELSVDDEGEYWSRVDRFALEGHFAACLRAMEDQLANDPRLEGPVRGPGGRIFDLVARE